MTPKEYGKLFARQHAIYERKAAPIFYRALRSQVMAVIQFMEQSGRTDSNVVDVITTQAMQQAYLQVYEMIGVDAALKEYKLLKKEEPTKADILTQFFSQKWALWMRQYALVFVGDLVQKVSDHTKERIRFALAQSYEQGLTFTQQIKLIRELTLGEIGRDRALTIARTESTRAANEGKRVGAVDWAKENGTTLYKKWVHTGRTEHDRTFHMVMDSEKPIKEREDFIVLGERMTQPGDPKASPKNTVNCACTMQFMSERKAVRDYGV